MFTGKQDKNANQYYQKIGKWFTIILSQLLSFYKNDNDNDKDITVHTNR